jgi:hypothetical protein
MRGFAIKIVGYWKQANFLRRGSGNPAPIRKKIKLVRLIFFIFIVLSSFFRRTRFLNFTRRTPQHNKVRIKFSLL